MSKKVTKTTSARYASGVSEKIGYAINYLELQNAQE